MALLSARHHGSQLLLLALVAATLVPSETLNEHKPHCADFRQYCAWNSSTSSCTFTKSMSFVCGPRQSLEAPVSISTEFESLMDANVVTTSSFAGDSTTKELAVAGFTCHWDVAGDLHFAPRVSVVVEGDDCLLHIGSGQMVRLGAQATLAASSLSVEASFVHLDEQAQISASYSGMFRHQQGLFTGTDVFGASYGGGGGQRLIANATMLTEQTTWGFFDARLQTVWNEFSGQKEAILKQSSSGWQLASLWTTEKDGPAFDKALNKTSSTSAYGSVVPFLLGSGSRAVIVRNNSKLIATVNGGGRIQIKASKDVVVMEEASIEANGGRAINGVSGGSGGSVFIAANALSVSGTIQAKGGDAFCSTDAVDRGITHCYPAGGGGRIQVTFMSSQLDSDAIMTTGGTLKSDQVEELLAETKRFRHVQISALAGAAGTYYQVVQQSDGVYEAQLFVDNKMQRLWPNRVQSKDGDILEMDELDTVIGGAITSVDVGDDETDFLDAVTITDGAVVATGILKLTVGDLKVLNGSFLLDALRAIPYQLSGSTSFQSTSAPPVVQICAQDIVVSSESRLMMSSCALQLSARSVSMDATAALDFSWTAQIVTSQNIHLNANVSSNLDPIISAPETTTFTVLNSTEKFNNKMLFLASEGDIFLGGFITVGALSVASKISVTITGHVEVLNIPSIKSAFHSCKEQALQPIVYLEADLEKNSSNSSPKKEASIPIIPTTLPSPSNFTLIVHARDSILLGESKEKAQEIENQLQQKDNHLPQPVGLVHGGAILLCATNLIEISSGSVISTDGMGERANQGPGMGSCASSIGGGAGYGGHGADSSVITGIGNYASGGLPYGTRSGTGMLGSGGGCVDGGSGGGIVILGASGLVLSGEVKCNGIGGANGAGGGSGGFLGLSVAQFLRGHGHISAVGGGSECIDVSTNFLGTAMRPKRSFLKAKVKTNAANEDAQAELPSTDIVPRFCGGGGGGGRLQLTGCELSTFDRCTREFDGNYTVAGGATSYLLNSGDLPDSAASTPTSSDVQASVLSGASGSFFGFPCPPGSGGLFCRLCSVGKYKSESNSAECVVCSNAPSNAHYVGVGEISARCDWACDPGYSGYYCVSPIQQLLDACGGEFGFALVLMSIVTFFILLGYACRNRKEPSYTRTYNSRSAKGERQHLLSSAVANSQRSLFTSLFRCFYWCRVDYPKLMERDLPEHMARLYFAGYNDPDSPLKLRSTVPPTLKKVLYDVEFNNLANRINRVLAWHRGPCSSWGKIVYFLVAVLCYPFASEVKQFRRHVRVNELKRIVGKYNHACMKGPRARGLLNAVKLGYCADYSLVYLELLYKESSQSVCVPTTKIGKPSLPLVLLFAGCGTYFSPFYLDPNDLLIRSIPQCPELTAFIDEPWIEFVAELNKLLRVVQQNKDALVESLLPVAVYLEKQRAMSAMGSNSSKLGGLRIYLGRFYVQDELDMGEEFKLGIFLTAANESSDSSSNSANLVPSHIQPSCSKRYNKYPKDSHRFNTNDVYGYERGDSLDYLVSRRDDGNFDNDAMLNDMEGWETAPKDRDSSSLNRSSESSHVLPLNPVSSIREEALRIRSNSLHGDALNINGQPGRSGTADDVLVVMGAAGLTKAKQPSTAVHHTIYEGWLGPVDASLPIPGVLICADELRERLADQSFRQMLHVFLRFHLLPRNLPRSTSLSLSWMLSISLLTLLMVDLAITFAILVNLKCVTEGEVDHDCSASIMVPVLLVPPLALVMSPIMGIISLALSSSTFTRRFSVWNALSMISVGIAILACIAQSSRLVAPWFAGPLPLLPVIGMGVKAGQAYLVERYIAFQETQRRRRGWRGIMKRRLSDASIPAESP
ncbi:hypothetical protein CCR75_007080 [Bremia lactucae]|uniref:DUF8003 domain-containing protein n=1 Tax=Bremia lactucae TaxID=4779 RepID=A0A976FGI2_BRELC|nr:hypothetical protein CCR75_007080 [Bremia lactucae]